MIFLFRSLFIILFILGPTLLLADLKYTYTLEDYPASEANCEEVAKSFAQKVEKLSGVRIYSVECKVTRPKVSFAIKMEYFSGYPIEKINAVQDYALGTYDDYSACKSDLTNQIALFNQNAGLEPLISYCSDRGALNIYYYGVAKMRRDRMYTRLGGFRFHPFIEDPRLIEEKIKNGAMAKGVLVSRVRLENLSLSLYYYSPRGLPLGVSYLLSYENLETCEKEAAENKSFLQNYGIEEFYSFCAGSEKYPDGAATQYIIGMQTKNGYPYLGEMSISTLEAPFKFDSLEACKSAKEEVAKHHRASTGYRERGILCTLSSYDPIQYKPLVYQ